MSEPAANYVPIELHKRFYAHAGWVWLATLIVVFAWVSLTLAAPLSLSGGFAAASTSIYTFFSYICHQIPERSLYLAGYQIAVCSRCFGVYLGLLIGILVYPVWRPVDEIEPIPRYWLFLSLVPITVDWSLTIFGVWENTHLSRFITGFILGAVCATFIVPALVEIVRNIAYRRRLVR